MRREPPFTDVTVLTVSGSNEGIRAPKLYAAAGRTLCCHDAAGVSGYGLGRCWARLRLRW
ncbi:MAG: hypothetical protein ACLUNQ_04710 [Oscillospiraceae bacterium]